MAKRNYLTPEQLRQSAGGERKKGVVDLSSVNVPPPPSGSVPTAQAIPARPAKSESVPTTTTIVPREPLEPLPAGNEEDAEYVEVEVERPVNGAILPDTYVVTQEELEKLTSGGGELEIEVDQPQNEPSAKSGDAPTSVIVPSEELDEQKAAEPAGLPAAPAVPANAVRPEATRPGNFSPAPPVALGKNARDYMDLHLPIETGYMSQKLHQKLREIKQKDYTATEILARGAECIVYIGKAGNETFCVKSIRNNLDKFIGNPETRKDKGKLNQISYDTKVRHLTNEFRIASMLQIDTIDQVPVHVYAMFPVKKLGLELGWDLLMERIYGIDLSDKELLKALTLQEKLQISLLICQAIDILHQKHIIHLDIKPSNFMLERTGRVRLIDFGISLLSGSRTKGVAGTAGYFSPEQIARGELNETTDIFALGVTLSIIFGAKPLVQNAKDALNKAYRSEANQSLQDNGSAITDIPELTRCKPIADVLRACSSYKRENRPQSCRALIRQLRTAAQKCGIELP